MQIFAGERAPFRRKDHAAVVFGDLMIIHGGTENRKVKSDIFVYNIPQDKWTTTSSTGSPYLNCHKMVQVQIKFKGYSNTKEVYMFGGLNRKG